MVATLSLKMSAAAWQQKKANESTAALEIEVERLRGVETLVVQLRDRIERQVSDIAELQYEATKGQRDVDVVRLQMEEKLHELQEKQKEVETSKRRLLEMEAEIATLKRNRSGRKSVTPDKIRETTQTQTRDGTLKREMGTTMETSMSRTKPTSVVKSTAPIIDFNDFMPSLLFEEFSKSPTSESLLPSALAPSQRPHAQTQQNRPTSTHTTPSLNSRTLSLNKKSKSSSIQFSDSSASLTRASSRNGNNPHEQTRRPSYSTNPDDSPPTRTQLPPPPSVSSHSTLLPSRSSLSFKEHSGLLSELDAQLEASLRRVEELEWVVAELEDGRKDAEERLEWESTGRGGVSVDRATQVRKKKSFWKRLREADFKGREDGDEEV